MRSIPNVRPATFSLLLLLLAAPVLTSGAEEAFQDAVLDGVVELLEAEISESVIVEWLRTVEKRPRTPTAQDMVALRRAGATDRVMTEILRRARGAQPAAPRAPTPPASAPDDEPSPAESADSELSREEGSGTSPSTREPRDFSLGTKPFEAPEPSDAVSLVPTGRGAIDAEFTLSYTPYFLEGEEEWNLFVYLNGEPITYVPTSSLFSTKPLKFRQLLRPGRQRLLVFQEQHREGRREHHAARIMPFEIEFDLEPGLPTEIEVAFKQTVIDLSDPVEYRVSQRGRLVTEGEVGGSPDHWDPLCEDIERTRGEKDRNDPLPDCVRWRSLWTETSGPTRSQVLRAFANFEYRPVPIDQRIH